jgi:hypothetical protein
VTVRDGPVEITGVWLRGGEDSVAVLVEIDGRWVNVISEFVPLHGNDGNVWPISHIVEPGGIRKAAAM